MSTCTYSPGTLVSARGRDWVVLADSDDELLVLRPLGGAEDEIVGVLPALEEVAPASFAPPTLADLGDGISARLLRAALRTGFRSSGGPFRSLASLAVEPRAYQYVPLMLALRQSPVRLLIGDDVGIGKTIEAGLIAAELLAEGAIRRLVVLASPALAEQWQAELSTKFRIDAELVLSSTAARLGRRLMLNESLFERHPYLVVSTDFIKRPAHRAELLNHCPELVIVDEAHNAVAGGTGPTNAVARHAGPDAADAGDAGTPGRNSGVSPRSGAGVSSRSSRSSVAARTQRYDLLRCIAADRSRHLVLVTATPHSGSDSGFRNLLGLLDPDLAELDLEAVRDRERLARHFVQRRRADIRRYLDEDTVFPDDRLSREAPYRLGEEYAAFAARLLDYARSGIEGDSSSPVRRRVRWWSALALLRAMASSPAAVAATLRTRAAALGATTPEEADALGRAAVLDAGTDDTLEGLDVTPGADVTPGTGDPAADSGPSDAGDPGADAGDPGADAGDPGADAGDPGADAGDPGRRERRHLLELARAAEALGGPSVDRKLATLVEQVVGLLEEGAEPIVFCRFIATAEYVAAELSGALARSHPDVSVGAVTGELPPALRESRIAELAARPGRHVLVATDCLSEGVNLQEHFSAVVHYDLAWNPTRHEQREGRVDRFGQRARLVRAVTIYGADNGVDRIVLDVLIRKHQAIRRDTGVSVPVPDEADNVVEALVEGLVLDPVHRPAGGRRPGFVAEPAEQLTLELGLAAERDALHRSWESAAERERASRTKYAQETIHPEEVRREVDTARAALGGREEAAELVVDVLGALGAPLRPHADGWTTELAALPSGLRDSLPAGLAEPLVVHRDLPVPRGHAVAERTDPLVEALARYTLDTALDTSAAHRIAARAGAIRTGAVSRRSTLLLVRIRLQLDLPGAAGTRQLVAEEARYVAFSGPATDPTWLDKRATEELLAARPDANLDPELAARLLAEVTGHQDALHPYLDRLADHLAAELLDAHRRVRSAAVASRRGLAVSAKHPLDVLGIYLYLPRPAP